MCACRQPSCMGVGWYALGANFLLTDSTNSTNNHQAVPTVIIIKVRFRGNGKTSSKNNSSSNNNNNNNNNDDNDNDNNDDNNNS